MLTEAWGMGKEGGALGLGGIAGACYAKALQGFPEDADKTKQQKSESDVLDMFAGNLFPTVMKSAKD